METKPTFYEKYIKSCAGRLLALIGMVVLSPVFLVIAAAIAIDDPGRVIFTQKRFGKEKRFFEIHKFRTMRADAPSEVPTKDMEDMDACLTKVGRFLRNTELDELPQLWDIFRGKMSFVGPRPVLWNTEGLIEERDRYGANDVMPGLTGLAQINGKDRIGYKEKAAWDGKYVEALRKSSLSGFAMDLRCIGATIGTVIREYKNSR